jgi:hypothetical protein
MGYPKFDPKILTKCCNAASFTRKVSLDELQVRGTRLKVGEEKCDQVRSR